MAETDVDAIKERNKEAAAAAGGAAAAAGATPPAAKKAKAELSLPKQLPKQQLQVQPLGELGPYLAPLAAELQHLQQQPDPSQQRAAADWATHVWSSLGWDVKDNIVDAGNGYKATATASLPQTHSYAGAASSSSRRTVVYSAEVMFAGTPATLTVGRQGGSSTRWWSTPQPLRQTRSPSQPCACACSWLVPLH